MSDTSTIRITRGRPDAEHIAAVVVALLALANARTEDSATDTARDTARWRRLERVPGHRGPRSWRGEGKSTPKPSTLIAA